MKRCRFLWILLPVLMLQGCPDNRYGYKYNAGTFPSSPVNFTAINSEYDDYNMSSPILGEAFPLCFSSTRNSRGEDFDIVYKFISIEFSKTTGELSILENSAVYLEAMNRSYDLNEAVRKVNSSHDELGPYLIHVDGASDEDGYYYDYIMLYSNDETGKQDIHFTHNTNSRDYENPIPVGFLNSDADDAYPCFNSDLSALYFCSNRDQNFDIYKALTNPEMAIPDILASEEEFIIEKDSILSSEWDDKCPFIAVNARFYQEEPALNNMLVFASNREGGFGGFDLYYSMLENGRWGEPLNFGAGINTEYDEYRPIVRPQYEFTNDFMIFSSNRPGGLGGFDLYYVGIPDIGNPW